MEYTANEGLFQDDGGEKAKCPIENRQIRPFTPFRISSFRPLSELRRSFTSPLFDLRTKATRLEEPTKPHIKGDNPKPRLRISRTNTAPFKIVFKLHEATTG